MEPSRIEMRSIIKIKDYLTRNERLKPDIRENDKTPSWDGEIFVYRSASIAKKDIIGRVAVQIKGSVKVDLSQKTIKYRLECSDFRNYLSSNGAILFVIYMKGYDDCKIYFNALLPFDLIKLIEQFGEQKTKTIELHEFPKDDPIEVINIFLNFIANQKLQGGTIDHKFLSLDNIGKLGFEIDGFHIEYTGIGLNNITDVINYSLRHPTYIYVQPKGFNIKVPVGKINADQILSDIKSPITVEGKTFYSSYKISHEIGKKILTIGKSLNFFLDTGKFTFKLSGSLLEQVTDIKFLIALYSNQKIEINGALLPKRLPNNPTEDTADIKKLKDHLYELEKIKSTLEILGVNIDLEIDKLSNQELDYLFYLVSAVLYNESVPLGINNMPGIGNLTIGNLIITLICKKADGDKYELLNFFGDHDLYCKCLNDGKDVILSPYIQLKKDVFMTISNINYVKIVDSIKNAPKSTTQDELANQLVLEMLKAYDGQKEKNLQLLESAQEIMRWLSEQSTLDSKVSTLNMLQIVKRMREFSPEELNQISEIKHNTTDVATLIGTSILLESFVEARLHYDRLPEDHRKEFDMYPIVKLWIGK
jgi:hypothetical protein